MTVDTETESRAAESANQVVAGWQEILKFSPDLFTRTLKWAGGWMGRGGGGGLVGTYIGDANKILTLPHSEQP